MPTLKSLCKKLLLVVLFIFYLFLLLFVIEACSRSNVHDTWLYFTKDFRKVTFNLLILLLTLSPFLLLKKRIFYIALVSVLWIFLSIANYILLSLRGTPLTGADFGMISNGLELLPKYLSTWLIILLAVVLLGIVGLLVFTYIKLPKEEIKYSVGVPLVIGFILIFPQITNYSLKNNIISKNFWDICGGYSEYGFPYSFLNSVVNNGISKPENYSKDTMYSLVQELKNQTSENLQLDASNVFAIADDYHNIITDDSSENSVFEPNIIIVQLESFIDPTWIEGISFNKDPIPNFRELSSKYSSGILSVPSIGGGTANTEFEVITGMTVDYFAAGEFPYNTLVSKKAVPSFAYYFNELGYDTHALHNYDGTYYSRYNAYKNLGFHTFTPLESMDVNEWTPFGWPKDTVLTNQIKSALTSSSTSDLVFAVSVQGHGGYANSYMDNLEIRIDGDCDDYNRNNIEYYASQVYEMDKFVGELIDMVESLNEPTIVAFYGDHIPSLGLKADKLDSQSLYATPYLIWDNLNLPKEDINLQSYELTSKILSRIGFPETLITKVHNSDLDEETKGNYLNLLQYDMLYGKNFTATNDEILHPRSDFRIGINKVNINTIETYPDSIKIIGDNFNIYSRVYVNGKETETVFADENTLYISHLDAKPRDIISVKQISASRSIEFSSSNEITLN